jgi:hypothetical protein
MQLGYSTGALALGDFRLGLERLRPYQLEAIELSALRANELAPLVEAIGSLDLHGYQYIALHAPSRFAAEEEKSVVEAISSVASRFNAIILHPDALFNRGLWKPLGERLCFENMDKRKSIGRTADELADLFSAFPHARLCFDLGHAWQVDHTMTESRQILRRFRERILQLHVSEVNTRSEHVPLTLTTVTAFRRVLDLLPNVPWILEAITPPDKIGDEIRYVRESFTPEMEFVPD